MFSAKLEQVFSLLITVKYVQDKPSTYDYSRSPRPCHNFIFMLEGKGEVKFENKTIYLNKGDFMFIPKDSTYTSKWQEKTEFRSIHFNFATHLDPFNNVKIPIQKIKLSNFNDALYHANVIAKYQFLKNEKIFLAISSLYYILESALSSAIYQEITCPTSITPAIEYLNEHFKEKVSVEQLASLCYLSPSRFYYLFKKQTGYSPIVYKNRISIFEACGALLVDKNKSVEEISVEYGFESAVYFRRLFKAITGKTPTQYREQETLL